MTTKPALPRILEEKLFRLGGMIHIKENTGEQVKDATTADKWGLWKHFIKSTKWQRLIQAFSEVSVAQSKRLADVYF